MTRESDSEQPLVILIAEDSPTDALLTKNALLQATGGVTVHQVSDGLELMQFLRREGSFTDAPRPDLVLLDLNMPRMDGREALTELKQDEALRQIPVVVLSTSGAADDICGAYNRQANSYIIKPMDFGQFVNVMESLTNFWFGTAALPSRTR